jgi:hypothetical protein
MAVATVVLLYNSWRYRAMQPDDSYIYDRYFWNVEHGHGLVYNLGQHFDGLTSPLYAYVMIAVGVVFRNPYYASWAVAIVTFCGAGWVLFRYGDRRGHGLAYSLGILVGFALPYFYLTYGMETGLLLLLIAACLYFFETSRYYLLLVCGALLVLTRTEDGLLLVALAIEHLIKRRAWPSWKVLIAPACLLAAHLTFERLYYGEFLPSTDMAKVYQGESGLWGTTKPIFLNIAYFPDFAFFSQHWLWVSLAVLSVLGLVVRWRELRPLLIFSVFYLAFFCILNIPDYHWYFAPLFLVAYVGVGCGVVAVGQAAAWLAKAVAERSGPSGSVGWSKPLATSVAGLGAAVFLFTGVVNLQSDAGTRMALYKRVATWMTKNIPANSTVAMDEIGVIGYYSHVQVIDILGLVSPDNAKFIGEREFTAWLTEYHPDYFLMHDPMWSEEVGVRQLADQGKLWIYKGFDYPGLTMFCQPGEHGCVPLPAGYVAP